MRIIVRLAFLGVLVSSPFVQSRGQTNTCHDANNESANVLAAVNALMTPEMGSLRARFGVPFAPESQISLVTDPTVCARARQALDSLVHVWAPNQPAPPPSDNPLYVIQVGSGFAVVDENGPPLGHYGLVFYFSPLWGFRTMLTF